MKSSRAILWMVLLLAWSGCGASMSPIEKGSEDWPLEFPELNGPADLVGSVPLVQVLSAAHKAGVLSGVPTSVHHNYQVMVACSPKDRWWDIVRKIEFISNVVYDAKLKEFHDPVATHIVDAPDEAGRATSPDVLSYSQRQIAVVRVMFVRGGAKLAVEYKNFEAGISGQAIVQEMRVPAGLKRRWSSTSERAYFEQVTDTQSGRTIPTQRKTVEAGVAWEGIAGILPRGLMRIGGRLTVTSFDEGTNRSGVDIPVDLDGARMVWHKVYQFRTTSAGLTATMRGLGLSLSGGAEVVSVYVRVD